MSVRCFGGANKIEYITMNESFLSRCLRYAIYAIAFVPLIIFSQYVSPFHFGKVVIFRSIVQIMIPLYALLVWRDRSYLPKGHPILWAFLAFAAAFSLTTATSVAFLQSFWGTLERMGGLFTFWHYVAYLVMLVSVVRTRNDWDILLNLFVGVGFLSAMYGVLQKTDLSFIMGGGGRARIFGTIGNTALFAGYQILVAFLALTMSFMSRTTKNWRIWYRGAAALMLGAVISTAVRGSLIGIVLGGISWALLWSVLNRSKLAKKLLLGGLTSVIVFVFLGLALRPTSLVQNSPYLRRVTDFSSSTFTVQTRFWAWSAGLKGWSESPKTMLVGWGPENFNIPFSKHFNPKFFNGPGSETFFDRAHNMFMEVLVTMGLVGLLSYLSMFAMLFIALAHMMKRGGDERVLGIGFTAMTIAYVVHNSFIFDTSANFITFFTLLGYVIHVAWRSVDAAPLKIARRVSWSAPQIFVAGLLAIVTALFVYGTNVRPSFANYASTRAIVASWDGDWVGAVNKYREAIEYDVPGRYEYRHRFAQYLLELGSTTDISKIPDFEKVSLRVAEDVKKNIQENPLDYLPYLYLSRVYSTLGSTSSKSPYNDMALEQSMKALDISPTFVRTYYEIAQVYLNKADYLSAYQWFKKAVDLQPEVGVSYWYLGSVRLAMAGKGNDPVILKDAAKLMTMAVNKGYAMSEEDAQRLLDTHLRLNDMANAAQVLELMVKNFPANLEYMRLLADTYANLGRVQDAITAARKVIELANGDQAVIDAATQFIISLGGRP